MEAGRSVRKRARTASAAASSADTPDTSSVASRNSAAPLSSLASARTAACVARAQSAGAPLPRCIWSATAPSRATALAAASAGPASSRRGNSRPGRTAVDDLRRPDVGADRRGGQLVEVDLDAPGRVVGSLADGAQDGLVLRLAHDRQVRLSRRTSPRRMPASWVRPKPIPPSHVGAERPAQSHAVGDLEAPKGGFGDAQDVAARGGAGYKARQPDALVAAARRPHVGFGLLDQGGLLSTTRTPRCLRRASTRPPCRPRPRPCRTARRPGPAASPVPSWRRCAASARWRPRSAPARCAALGLYGDPAQYYDRNNPPQPSQPIASHREWLPIVRIPARPRGFGGQTARCAGCWRDACVRRQRDGMLMRGRTIDNGCGIPRATWHRFGRRVHAGRCPLRAYGN